MIRLLLAVLLLLSPLPVLAHAGLVSTDPEDGATLETAPETVTLRFNEPVTPISVRLLDGTGREQALPGLATVENNEVRVALPGGLGRGQYTLSYRVTSADAHPVTGAILFGIGVAVEARGAGPAMDASGDLIQASMLLRALANGATLLLVGGALAALILRVSGRWCVPLALLALLGHGVGVWVQGGVLLGEGWAGLVQAQAGSLGLASTRGPSFLLLLIGVSLLTLPRAPRWVSLVSVAAVFGSYLLTGHAASAPPEWLAKPVLFAHVTIAGFWIGALPVLAHALDKPNAAALVARFSRLALLFVPLLLAAGVGLSLLQGITPFGLILHPYGQLLLIKLLFVLGLLALAALNRLVLTPRFARHGSPMPLRRAIVAEGVMIAGLLLATGVLSQTPPPRAEDHAPHHSGTATTTAGYSSLTPFGNRLALITLTPAKSGPNEVRVLVTDLEGMPHPPLEAVARVSLPDAGIENLRRPLVRDDDGFRLAPLVLPTPGTWRIDLDLLISDFERRTLTFSVSVP
jgi:copper transport protein